MTERAITDDGAFLLGVDMYDPIWICKDGRRMKVGQMHISHLRNAINKIERSRNWRKGWLPRLYLELELRSLNQ